MDTIFSLWVVCCGDIGGAWLFYAQLCDDRHTGHASDCYPELHIHPGLVFPALHHATVRRDGLWRAWLALCGLAQSAPSCLFCH